MIKHTTPQVTDAPLILVGSGGHARALIGILRQCGATIDGIVTADSALLGTSLGGISIRWLEQDFHPLPTDRLYVNALGNQPRAGDSGLAPRAAIVTRYHALGAQFVSVISPHAVVSEDVTLEDGVQLFHGAILQPGVQIASHSIINTGAIVEHDSRIGRFCHVAPGALLCGEVTLGDHVHIGANATVLQQCRIGAYAVVGAGTCVRRDIAENTTFYAAS